MSLPAEELEVVEVAVDGSSPSATFSSVPRPAGSAAATGAPEVGAEPWNGEVSPQPSYGDYRIEREKIYFRVALDSVHEVFRSAHGGVGVRPCR